MDSGIFAFEGFVLDPANRRLSRGGVPVELNARYLDALALLLRDGGRLVSKDRFLAEVWRGVPVTDEALTQCIRTLRRQLGDNAASPRFIETVPKHGYRFIAPVERVDGAPERAAVSSPDISRLARWRRVGMLGAMGTAGGGVAGLVGGAFYGFVGGSPAQPGMGAVSVLLVLACLSVAVALIGAAGVAFGIVAASAGTRRLGPWSIAGGAVGGLIVGAVVKLLGLDAFELLFGHSPGDITGAAEGALLGAAVGLGGWLGDRGDGPLSVKRSAAAAGATGGAGGALIAASGGRLMGGSLDLLARGFPLSRLRFDPFGGWLGEQGFGPVSQIVAGGLEGALFGGCILAAMTIARHRLPGMNQRFTRSSARS